MLDSHLHPRLKPLLNAVAGALDRPGISPDGLTLVGFAIGVLALPFLALGWYGAALAAILLNRLLDGLDGALARRRGLTDAGGFLDIALDFLFYALVPFGFILADPLNNALAGGWLLFAFIGTGSSFLAFAALAARHQIANPGYAHKSLYYLGGLTEGTETILLFVLGCAVWALFRDALRGCFGATGLCGLLLHSYQPPSYTATCGQPMARAYIKVSEARQPVPQ
ncbi:CDP-alcohol phosphatidyltransferase family protein [Klebsiella pneumoniae]